MQGLLQIEPAPMISGSAVALFFVCTFIIMSISKLKFFNFRSMINTAHMQGQLQIEPAPMISR